jgi:hypothetical protein
MFNFRSGSYVPGIAISRLVLFSFWLDPKAGKDQVLGIDKSTRYMFES